MSVSLIHCIKAHDGIAIHDIKYPYILTLWNILTNIGYDNKKVMLFFLEGQS
jgi:hypothetical protein